MKYPVVRDLDGIYFRVKRGEKWDSLCWTDLTYKEQEEVSSNKSFEWWKSVAYEMSNRLRQLGDEFDIVVEEDKV